jgi:hypothetical protein
MKLAVGLKFQVTFHLFPGHEKPSAKIECQKPETKNGTQAVHLFPSSQGSQPLAEQTWRVQVIAVNHCGDAGTVQCLEVIFPETQGERG